MDQEVEMLRVQGVGFAKRYLGRDAFGSLGRNLFREPTPGNSLLFDDFVEIVALCTSLWNLIR